MHEYDSYTVPFYPGVVPGIVCNGYGFRVHVSRMHRTVTLDIPNTHLI